MVEYRLLTENESVLVASQANALPPLKGNEVTPSGVVVRMSILDTKVAGSNLSINMFSP